MPCRWVTRLSRQPARDGVLRRSFAGAGTGASPRLETGAHRGRAVLYVRTITARAHAAALRHHAGREVRQSALHDFPAAHLQFERDLSSKQPSRIATQYFEAASRQTDNIGPRNVRQEILIKLLSA